MSRMIVATLITLLMTTPLMAEGKRWGNPDACLDVYEKYNIVAESLGITAWYLQGINPETRRSKLTNWEQMSETTRKLWKELERVEDMYRQHAKTVLSTCADY